MGIKIEKITVKNLGPIQSFSKEFGLLNLIYSKNECGKTFLTEFIIRSLFKNTNIKRWKFREGGVGNISVSGLDRELIEFSPSKSKKLEDYWEKDEIGLPPSMVKLLVSKGGEPSIEDTEEGIDKNLIKEIFSGISLLDDIDNNISKTVKFARFINGNIDIRDQGEGKDYHDLQADISQIDKLFTEIESKYVQGIIESYRIEEESLKKHLEELKRAKRYEAYLISKKIDEIEGKLAQIPDDKLNEISTKIEIYEYAKNDYNNKKRELEEFQEKSKHFDWLEEALKIYERLTISYVKKPSLILLFISGIFTVATVILISLNLKFGTILPISITAILSFFVTIGLTAFYIRNLFNYSKYVGPNEELNRIKVEFKNKTGNKLTDIALLNAELSKQKEFYDKAKFLEEQLEVIRNDYEKQHFSIQQKFNELADKQISESDWLVFLNTKKQNNNKLKANKEEERTKLINLEVRETDYLNEDSGVKFDIDEFSEVNRKLEEISAKIIKEEEDINILKHSVCIETKDDFSINWEQLIEKLKKKRFEKQNDLNTSEAKISAGIIIHNIISKLSEEEDEKVLEGLQSETVLKPLREITHRYNKISIEGDNVKIYDDYKDYYLKDLSTGAREQIMLALRIGFSSKLLKKDTLFLILDDAFQHSDWERRETLVKRLADIAKDGWQIIYLTMDDHIKGLFDKVGKEFEAGKYNSFEL